MLRPQIIAPLANGSKQSDADRFRRARERLQATRAPAKRTKGESHAWRIAANGTRAIALVGPAGAGKTSLAEAMLFAAGATDRLGSTANGSQHRRQQPGSAAARRLDRAQPLQFQISRRRIRDDRRPRLDRLFGRRRAGRRDRRPRDRRRRSGSRARAAGGPGPARCSTSSASRTSSSSIASTRPTAESATSCRRSSR